MANVTAAMVKSLREKTGLPMMECKKALVHTDGDEEAAHQWIREQGKKTQETRLGRDTSEGRISAYTDGGVGSLVELQCESAPVTSNEDFIQLANDLAQQMATGPGATTAEELLAQPSPSNSEITLQAQKDDLFNRIREVFNVGRVVRFGGNCASYIHHDGSIGVLVHYTGDNADVARDIAMHICAKQPSAVSKEQLDQEAVEKERTILSEAARKEGKPENIIEKMIEGRMRNYYEQSVLNEQAFIKDETQNVAKVAEAAGLKIIEFASWKLGKPAE